MLRSLISPGFLRRLWKKAKEDNVPGRAAQLSYYFLLALFPFLLFLVTLFGYFTASVELRHQLITYLSSVVPRSAVQLVVATVDEVIQARGSGKLSAGLLISLWAASSGMQAVGQALNTAYGLRETRPWWRVRLVSVLLTVTLSMLITSALAIVLYGGRLGEILAGSIGFGPTFISAWAILQWPIALLFVLFSFSVIYHFAPDLQTKDASRRFRREDYRRRWLTPGVVVAVLLWLLVSLGFRLYLHYFNSYAATYGSLGALIVLMFWFYLSGAAILFGAEINCELERSSAASSSRES